MKQDDHIPYEALGRFLSKKIDADERASIERHLKDCEFCRQDMADAEGWRASQPEPLTWWQRLRKSLTQILKSGRPK